jgi:hypothetical protein
MCFCSAIGGRGKGYSAKKGSPDQRVIIKTYVEKQAKNRRRIFSKLRNP